jgi:thioesterase domain-containing protein/acyl carrier protein
MKREEITIAHLTPAMVQLMTEIGIEAPVNGGNNIFPSSLRYAFFGGDTLTKRDVSRFQDLFPSATCINFYGATETPQAMGYFIIPKQKDNVHDDAIAKETIPLGRGIEGVQLLVLNDARQLTGTGELGEIHVRTPYLARGYLGDNALTQQRFITNPFTGIPGDRLYKTGDKGRYLSDGSLDFVGRTDHQVKIRGFRIELGEIEAVLGQHPAVRQTVVVAREDPTEEHFAAENPKPKTRTELSRSIDPSRASRLKSDKRLVAYVVLDQEPPSTLSDLRRFLHEKLPDYMVPSVFVFLDALPLTPNGKVDRRALPAPNQAKPELKQNFVAPRSPVEERLAVIWAQVLGVKQVGVTDNFFDVGGHSLLAVRLFAEIEKEFKKRLLLSSLFQGATIEHLADLINQRTPLPSQLLVAIQPKGSKRPFFCVHEFFGDVLCYMNLARCLGPDRPFYALQARGLDGTEEPLADIATMAAHYIEEIRSVQSEGPYALGGLCLGGIVAFEMAQQLRAKGEAVALVALLDSGINRKQGRVAWWWSFVRNLPRDLPSWLIGSLQLNRVQWVNLIKLKSRMAKARLAVTFRSPDVGPSLGYSLIEEMGDLSEFSEQHRKVARAQSQALREYRPQIYSGPLTLFRARMQPFFSSHRPDKGWSPLAAGGLDIKVIPGNHLGMLQEPHVRVLAEQLRACLDEAKQSGHTGGQNE